MLPTGIRRSSIRSGFADSTVPDVSTATLTLGLLQVCPSLGDNLAIAGARLPHAGLWPFRKTHNSGPRVHDHLTGSAEAYYSGTGGRQRQFVPAVIITFPNPPYSSFTPTRL